MGTALRASPHCGDDLGGGSCRFALSGCAQKHAVFSDPNKAFRSSSGNLRRFGAASHLGVLRALSSWIQKTIVIVVVMVAVAVTVAVAVAVAVGTAIGRPRYNSLCSSCVQQNHPVE